MLNTMIGASIFGLPSLIAARLGRGESFHYVSHGVCTGGKSAIGSRRHLDGASWIFGGGELSRSNGWKMAEQFFYNHKNIAADAFRYGGPYSSGPASGNSRDSRGGAGHSQGLVCGGVADGLRIWRI